MAEYDWPRYLPRDIPCAHCGVLFPAISRSQAKHFKYDGSVSYCSPICEEAARQKRAAAKPLYGPCPTCGARFYSRVPKTFCSVDCYVRSDRFRQIVAERGDRLRGRPRPEARVRETRACLECGSQFSVIPSRPNKFCSRNCYHVYMAKRFDRNVASPGTIEIGQGYDEFLSEPLLRCPIPGCDWEGHWLSLHVNYAHAIVAEDFKRAAGFNLKQGLISFEMREVLERRQPRGVATTADFRINPHGYRERGGYVSLQDREAKKKLRALRQAEYDAGPPSVRTCDGCGTDFPQPSAFGRMKFCSVKCRSAFYARRCRCGEAPCVVCGTAFLLTKPQAKRHAAGLLVVCSNACRAHLNSGTRRRGADKHLRDNGLVPAPPAPK